MHPLPDQLSHRLIDGTGVRLLLANAEFRQHVDYVVRGDLQLSSQLINSNFTHTKRQRYAALRLADPLRVLYSIKFGFLAWRVSASNIRSFHCFGLGGGDGGFAGQRGTGDRLVATFRN